jgi:hypothetical protein
MDSVIAKLETELGGALPFFSCDIGIRNLQQLQGEFDEKRLHDNMVFFETQAIPGPPRGKSSDMGDHSLRAYMRLGTLFIQEHRTEIVQRAKAVIPK